MNLVAKEYVASQVDEKGVIVVSHLAGAAEELSEALVVNPYDEEGMAEPASSTPLVAVAINRLDLERAIEQLPDGCRTAFVLHDVEGFAHHEVAAMLGISEGTSKSQVHKARFRLRSMLSAAVK